MAVRVHYHTDCSWFAGCENMLANLLNDPDNRRQCDVSLSYRASAAYTAGLRMRTKLDFPVFPLRFPEPSAAFRTPATWPAPMRRGVRVASRGLATYPLLAYEIWLLWRLFARLAPDVVHINNGGYPGALSARAAAIAARLAGVEHVVMVVNNMAEAYQRPYFILRPAIDRQVVRAVSCFITGSAAAAEQLRRVLKLKDGVSAAYPNGVALRPTSEARGETLRRLGIDESNGILLGTVALMEPRKGHRVLLEAIAQLLGDGESHPNFTVLLEGDGPLRGALEEFTRASGLEHRCRFIGTEPNVMNLMAAIDVLVLPSISHEDFPNVILEAMGMAKPVIASRLAGTPEQVEDGITGMLVGPGNPRALAAAIARMIEDAPLREEMGRAAGRRFAERFTAFTAVSRYVALYQSLTAEPKI